MAALYSTFSDEHSTIYFGLNHFSMLDAILKINVSRGFGVLGFWGFRC